MPSLELPQTPSVASNVHPSCEHRRSDACWNGTGGGDGGGEGGGEGGGGDGGGDGGGEGAGMMHRTLCVNALVVMSHSAVVASAIGFPLHVSGVNMSSVMHRPLSFLQQDAL